MMRPRAGQRNSGSVPAASACAPVSGIFDCDAPDSRLPVGVLSIAGFFTSDDLDGSASATAAPLDSLASFDADFSASLAALSALAGLLFLFVLRLLGGLGEVGVGDVRVVFLCRPSQCWRPRGHRRDRRAPQGASRSSPQRRSKGRWRREAQKPARRSGPKACPASRHWRRRSASRRRRSSPRPIRPPPAASRAKRCASRTRRARLARAAKSSRRTSARRESYCSRKDW